MSDITTVRENLEESLPDAAVDEAPGGISIRVDEPDENGGRFYGAIRRAGIEDSTQSGRVGGRLFAFVEVDEE